MGSVCSRMVDLGGDWWLGYDGRWRQGLPPPGWRRAHDGNWYPADRMPTIGSTPPGPAGTGGGPDRRPTAGPPAGAVPDASHPPSRDDDGALVDGVTGAGAPADPTDVHLAGTTGVAGGVYGTPPPGTYGDAYDDTYDGYGDDYGDEDGDWEDDDPQHLRAGWLIAFASWPAWARIGAPSAAALIVLAGLVAGGNLLGGGDSVPASATGRPVPSTSPVTRSTTTTSTTTTSSTTTTTTPTTTTTTTTAPPTTAAPQPPPAPPATAWPTTTEPEVHYRNCREAWEAGAAPLHEGDPGFDPAFDLNGNGLACDRWDTWHGDRR